MPLYQQKNLIGDCRLAIWKVEEDEDFFKERIDFTAFDKEELDRIHVPSKRIQWLASRLCAKLVVQAPFAVEMRKQDSGRPELLNVQGHLSISHSKDYVAALYSDELFVGLDVEEVSTRVEKIEHKFASSNESAYLQAHDRTKHLCLLWSMKESLFKIFPLSGIEFKSQIAIEPFVLKQEGKAIGSVIKGTVYRKYLIEYLFFDGYCLSWTSHRI